MPDYRHPECRQIVLERSPIEHIARLTLNRPERRNALKGLEMDLETSMQMAAAIREGRTPQYEGR